MSIYTEIRDAGIATDSHESDLYFPVSPDSTAILEAHPEVSHTTFISQIDGKRWYEVPFSFDPWWEKRIGRAAP